MTREHVNRKAKFSSTATIVGTAVDRAQARSSEEASILTDAGSPF